MRRLAVLSLHTSPLAQPGTGDGGGMNVYVRELSSALARAGVICDVFTRAWRDDLPATVMVEPGSGSTTSRPARPRRWPRSHCPASSTSSPTACSSGCGPPAASARTRTTLSTRSTPTTG